MMTFTVVFINLLIGRNRFYHIEGTRRALTKAAGDEYKEDREAGY